MFFKIFNNSNKRSKLSISIIDIKNNKVWVQLHGSCVSCSVNQMTLKVGVETTIKRHAPEITEVIKVDAV